MSSKEQYNGTGANVLGLSGLTRSYHSIICSELAHINVDESTAPEKFTGCKLIGIPTKNGKILPEQIEEKIQRLHKKAAKKVRCPVAAFIAELKKLRAIKFSEPSSAFVQITFAPDFIRRFTSRV